MSLFSLIKQSFLLGGPFFMTIHLILWILVIFFTVKFLLNYFSDKRNLKKLNKMKSYILFIGGYGFLLSIFYQLLGFFGALSAIEIAHDISPAMILGGFKISLIAPLFSLFLLLISSIIWFFFRNLIQE